LAQIDKSGNIGFYIDITEHFYYRKQPQLLVLDDAGYIYLQLTCGEVLLFNSTGEHQATIPSPEAEGAFFG